MSTPCNGIKLLLLAMIPFIYSSCSVSKSVITKKKWINWNAAFFKDFDTTQRKTVIDNMKADLEAVQSDNPPGADDQKDRPLTYYMYHQLKDSLKLEKFAIINVNMNFCTCREPDLLNIVADLQATMTANDSGSVGTTKPPPGITSRSGAIEGVDVNVDINDPKIYDIVINDTGKLYYPTGFTKSKNAVLAVIDTGIDTMLLNADVRSDLFWNGPGGSKNFMPNSDVDDFSDDNPLRHGTIVTGLAMNAFYEASGKMTLPKLMVLKALDKTGNGTLFEFLCALSYAISNHATVINTSFGYKGPSNLVMNLYLAKSKRDSIPLVAAAGNDLGKRSKSQDICFNGINPGNLLMAPNNLFYPACSAADMVRYAVISATGFSNPGMPCYYQFYSPDYVTLGVYNQVAETKCCAYRLSFFNSGLRIEGSSFATAVTSGQLTWKISQGGRRPTVSEYVNLLNVQRATTTPFVTMGNQYLTY